MNKTVRIVKYCWFVFIMTLTGWLPDFKLLMRMRGLLLKPCFKKCGRNFQICSRAMIVNTSNVSIGDNVYIAYGCWIQGHGGVSLGDEVMLGPYTVLASSRHLKKGGSYRFGGGDSAPIVMMRGSWTGAHVVVIGGVTIGPGAACGAGAVVTRDVPEHAMVGGVPARPIATGGDEAE